MEVGEFELIEWIRGRAGETGGRWRIGIGDDAALLRPRAGRELVITTDALVEDVHFRWSTTDPEPLAEKALHSNLSDLAAMGAEPIGFLLSLLLPRGLQHVRIERFLRALLRAARVAGCPLVGGDTTASAVAVLSLVAFGEVERGRALRRDAARAGDRILVTGTLGEAALGLAWLEGQQRPDPTRFARFVRRQLRPRARLREGRSLASQTGIGAAIDLSDGLIGDLGHLLQASRVGAELDADALPLSRGFGVACRALGLDPRRLALQGGEDYELLFTVRERAPSATAISRRLRCRVTEVGRVRAETGLSLHASGDPLRIPGGSFEHFKAP